MINRILLIKLHVLLAVFILPVAIMFFLTGALYSWGIKGEYTVTVHNIALQKPLSKQHNELIRTVKEALNKQEIPFPTGKAKIKTIGKSFLLEWTGSDKDVVLTTTANPYIAELQIKQAGWHRYFVQLHKAKGSIVFKVYATVLAVALCCLFISGFIMAWQLQMLRHLALTSSIIGLFSFCILAYLS